MDYKLELIHCLEMVGVFVPYDEANDVDLTEYQIDSITFVSFMVEVEEHFDIMIPDEYLTYETIKSLNGYANLIAVLCEAKCNNLKE